MMAIDMDKRVMKSDGKTVNEGDWISLDGGTGEAYIGKLDLSTPDLEEQTELMTLLDWSDEIARLQVWANADYPADARRARSFGAKGIGLCRTEHMFFEQVRLPFVQKMILNAEEAQKLINNAERLKGFLKTGKVDGQKMRESVREEIEAEFAKATETLEKSKAVKEVPEGVWQTARDKQSVDSESD